ISVTAYDVLVATTCRAHSCYFLYSAGALLCLHSFPTRRSSDLNLGPGWNPALPDTATLGLSSATRSSSSSTACYRILLRPGWDPAPRHRTLGLSSTSSTAVLPGNQGASRSRNHSCPSPPRR